MHKAALALSMIMLAGCATTGSRISQSQMDRVVIGQTTREEVLSVFGAPYSEGIDGSGNLVLSYAYAHVGFAGIGTEVQAVSFVIGPDGKVARFSRGSSTPIPSSAKPLAIAPNKAPDSTGAVSAHIDSTSKPSTEQQIDELQRRNLPYEGYQKEYKRIMEGNR